MSQQRSVLAKKKIARLSFCQSLSLGFRLSRTVGKTEIPRVVSRAEIERYHAGEGGGWGSFSFWAVGSGGSLPACIFTAHPPLGFFFRIPERYSATPDIRVLRTGTYKCVKMSIKTTRLYTFREFSCGFLYIFYLENQKKKCFKKAFSWVPGFGTSPRKKTLSAYSVSFSLPLFEREFPSSHQTNSGRKIMEKRM